MKNCFESNYDGTCIIYSRVTDPTEGELINTANDFANEYNILEEVKR